MPGRFAVCDPTTSLRHVTLKLSPNAAALRPPASLSLFARADRTDRVPGIGIGSLGKRIKAALLCKTLPKDDNPAEYVNGSSSSPSRNLVTAIKLAGYVVHCGTGGKVSAVDGDGREVGDAGTEQSRAAVCFVFRMYFRPKLIEACAPSRFGSEGVLRVNSGACAPQPACEPPSL